MEEGRVCWSKLLSGFDTEGAGKVDGIRAGGSAGPEEAPGAFLPGSLVICPVRAGSAQLPVSPPNPFGTPLVAGYHVHGGHPVYG